MALDLTSIIGQLGTMDKDALQELLQGAKKQIGQIQEQEKAKKEEEYVEELQPFKEKLAALEAQVKSVGEAYDQKINELKDKKKAATEQAREAVDKFLAEYNEFRKGKGLAQVSLSTRKRTTGKQHSYSVVWPEDAKDSSFVRIAVDEGTPSDPIDTTGTISVGPIKEFFSKMGIADETGGKARGIVNRIKKEKQAREAKAQPAEAVS